MAKAQVPILAALECFKIGTLMSKKGQAEEIALNSFSPSFSLCSSLPLAAGMQQRAACSMQQATVGHGALSKICITVHLKRKVDLAVLMPIVDEQIVKAVSNGVEILDAVSFL